MADPIGDGGNVDIVEAGVNYGRTNTRLWIRFTSEATSRAGDVWFVSTDGDRTPEFRVYLGGDVEPDYYLLYSQGDGITRCAGYVPNGGHVKPDTVELTHDSRCFQSGSGHSAPDTVRISAGSEEERGDLDLTDWTDVVPIS